MYYSVVIYPRLDSDLRDSIQRIRGAYDPTANLIQTHITVVFPANNQLAQQELIEHSTDVLSSWNSFPIRLGGFQKSRDHWLFLTLEEGNEEILELYHELYTGCLARFKREGHTPVPHIGLGLFIRKGCDYDWRHPRDEDFDRERYEEALLLAQSLPLPASVLVDRVHLTGVPEVIIEWTTGKRRSIPDGVTIDTVQEFFLG